MEKEYKKIISFLKNYQTHTNARGYVLGISGGKDWDKEELPNNIIVKKVYE